MSRFLPTSAYAEDQPLPKFILTSHVLHRGFQSGAIVGALTVAARPSVAAAYARIFSSKGAASTSSLLPTAPRLLAGAARGSLIVTALSGVALVARMRGRADIEWADRSWRLQHNAGQLETDDWSAAGTAVGVVVAAVARRPPPTAMSLLGGAALGNAGGVAAYMAWRYGVNRGKR